MAEDVKARRGVHLARHGARVERIADAKGRAKIAVCDACLCSAAGQIEDGGSSRFGAGAGGRRNGDQGMEGACDGLAFAEGCIHEVKELGVCGGDKSGGT